MDDEKYIRSVGGEGILNPSDVPELSAAKARVLQLMFDHDWHCATQILAVSGQREGLRRLRELRKNYTIERRRLTGTRDFEYRLPFVIPVPLAVPRR
jgi:hypothetical protein